MQLSLTTLCLLAMSTLALASAPTPTTLKFDPFTPIHAEAAQGKENKTTVDNKESVYKPAAASSSTALPSSTPAPAAPSPEAQVHLVKRAPKAHRSSFKDTVKASSQFSGQSSEKSHAKSGRHHRRNKRRNHRKSKGKGKSKYKRTTKIRDPVVVHAF
ncbi:hypothetical protein BJ684DRAFT_16676 [Piptocephalis cylindrospora]|uniref:Uncharacterized protein n=1 Tax=Piptocephalis cylindrospora TaxID=1907219 RepID=A0A4P9Y251_9FUNG|nr:hypothetical protein BJ684DRAFT_16676 [Piptocephalis cylindrospora]|eukprot:RKP12885.1 hypothetical protein BJ684DRAFT_16676 [Piptocephalis cylindrospora]